MYEYNVSNDKYWTFLNLRINFPKNKFSKINPLSRGWELQKMFQKTSLKPLISQRIKISYVGFSSFHYLHCKN